MMSKKLLVFFLNLFVILSIGQLRASGQEKEINLKDKLISVQMENKPLFSIFIQLIYKYDVPIGFEESALDKEHDDYNFQTNVPPDGERKRFFDRIVLGDAAIKNHLITVNFKDARLEEVLNSIVKQMRNYDWEINNDVVNIFPIKGRDPKIVKLMNLKISEFSVPKGSEVGIIQPLILLKLPEFRKFLEENDLYAESDRNTPWYIERPLTTELNFSDLTFKELLNAITKSKRGGWILKRNKLKKTENKDKDFIDLLI